MFTFARLAGFAFVLLSMGFLVSAIPVARHTYGSIYAPTGQDAVSTLLCGLTAKIEGCINALLACNTKAELSVAVDALIVVLKGCSDELLKIGAGVALTVEAKTSLVASICSMITLLLKVCAAVSAKFGILAVLSLFAKIDLCLKLLLVNLNICIGGILALIVKGLGGSIIALFGQLAFGGCFGVLGLGLGASVNVGAGISLGL